MEIHASALFVHNTASELISKNDWLQSDAPLLWIGTAPEGMIWRVREDVPATTKSQLETLIAQEPKFAEGPLPVNDKLYRDLLNAPLTSAGPTYWLPDIVSKSLHSTCRLSELHTKELERGQLADWIPDIPHQQPMIGSLESEGVVSICASVRIVPEAHEAGVETAATHRGKGYATSVVNGWASELIRLNIIPLYSTSWNNHASQAVAARTGFRRYGWEYAVG